MLVTRLLLLSRNAKNLCDTRTFASLTLKPRNSVLRQVSGRQAEITIPFGEKPRPLSVNFPTGNSDIHEVPPPGFKGYLLRILGFYSKEAKLIRGARFLYERIIEKAEDVHFYEALGLEKKFRTTYSLIVLHVWLTLARLRPEEDGKQVGQVLYEIFYHDVEKRVVAAGVKVLISKWMKELEKNFYGASKAYDKAILPEASPEDLPNALWRNVFSEDSSEMPTGEAAIPVHLLAQYVRRELESLKMTDSKYFMRGAIQFSSDYQVHVKS